MKREIQPELSAASGQARIPKDVAISKRIAQFWNPQNHPESHYTQADLIREISSYKAVTELNIGNLSLNEQCFVYQLLENNNKVAAVEIIKKPSWVRDNMYQNRPINALYLKTLALQQNGVGSYMVDHIDIDRSIVESRALEQISTNIQRRKGWYKTWKRELRTLTPHYGLYDKNMVSKWSMQVNARKTIEWNG